MSFELAPGVSLTGERLKRTEEFLASCGLTYEGGADYTVQLLSESGDILGTGSLCGKVLKYIAVDPSLQGEGGTNAILSELVSGAYLRGLTRLLLFTKAGNESTFRSMGFYTVAKTHDVCLMENSAHGFDRWLASLKKPEGGVTGAAVMNCNPFTLGHRYLVEQAAKAVDNLMVFIVSEDRSRFAFEDRLAMVHAGTEGIPNVIVQPGGDYMISSATFPTYFMKEGQDKQAINAALDITLFGQRIAPALGITR
ncbi:MAG: adenylyltransferase/cytidyltransferase family protein, partial [Clostridia bacterium]|nr:adenylyltransferase/cytidyltransferase family protein [Clostridia bacterium]